MLPRLVPHLERLGSDMRGAPLGTIRGWIASELVLTEEQIQLACDAYRTCLIPNVPEEIRAAFAADGESIDQFLLAQDESDDTLTRSDITELVAAALIMKSEGIHGSYVEMPNVPKRSRGSSEHGADYVALRLSAEGSPTEWGPGDMLFVGSVKHTTVNPDDMRRKLVSSLGKARMPRRKLRGEMRVLVDQLSRSGIDARKGFLALLSFPDPKRVTLVAVGVVAPVYRDPFVANLDKLPTHVGGRRVVAVVIENLDQLHRRVA